jgi:hypothetical protein
MFGICNRPVRAWICSHNASTRRFSVIQFGGGHFEIWWDNSDNPRDDTWKKIAIGLPDWSAASIALDNARAENLCP